MRHLIALAVVVSACTTGLIADPLGAGERSTPGPVADSTAVVLSGPTIASAASEAVDNVDPVALITPAGPIVAVRAETAAGYIVTSTCGNAAYVTGGIPILHADVVIDPGHGGPIDTGAVGRNGLAEKAVNLQVARAVQRKLAIVGIGAVLTRTGDYAVPLNNRAAFADAVAPELMVSIHHNAPTPGRSSRPGSEVFVQSHSVKSLRLGGLLWERSMTALGQFDIPWTAAPDSGVLHVLLPSGTDAYGMIRRPETVTALIELAYISSPAEAELLATPRYVDVAGEAVADAIIAYLKTDDHGGGYVAEPRVFRPQPGLRANQCEDAPLTSAVGE